MEYNSDDHKTVTISKEDVIASRQPSTQMKSSSKTNKQVHFN